MKLLDILSKADNLYDYSLPVLSITKKDGLVLQNEFLLFTQQIDKSKYFGGVRYAIC